MKNMRYALSKPPHCCQEGLSSGFCDTNSAIQSQSGVQDLTVTHSYMTVKWGLKLVPV